MDEREVLAVDVVFVGGGPASLAGAIRLATLAKAADRELSIVVLEKAAAFGDHSLSGAVLDPRALDELLAELGPVPPPPLDTPVAEEALWYLTEHGRFQAPWIPPPMHNHGHNLVSVQRLVAWLAERASELGVDCLPESPAVALCWDQQRITGVQIGDKGRDAAGNPREHFELGPYIQAKITILGDGVRGNLTKQAIARLGLGASAQAPRYALGIKELWQLPPGRFPVGKVVHTLGVPLPTETFGGGWLYGLHNNILDLGLVVGLDSPDPSTDAHDAFNRFKLHPVIRPLLRDAQLLAYGAKALPEGGLYSIPRLSADGVLLIGDAANMLNGLRLKGIHLAMKSGMLAAQAAFTALQADCYDTQQLAQYDDAFRASWAYTELYQARNVHQGFEHGLGLGLMNAGLGMFSGGRGFGVVEALPITPAQQRLQKITEVAPRAKQRRVIPDGVVTFDKLSDVFHSGTHHDEAQAGHLHVADTSVCAQKCTREYGNPCQYFCPAQVYRPNFIEHDGRISGQLDIDFANCVHCKTCDIVDPYQIITWVPPQGGDGPVYTGM